MGNGLVAEGPFIKPVPGGYAEWRAKETGLPPARLVNSEGEWWGQLVGPRDEMSDIAAGRIDTGIDTGDPGEGGTIYSPAPDFDPDALTKPSDPNWDYYTDTKVDPYEWKTDYTPVDWDVDYNPMPQGYGWGVSTGSPILPYAGGAGSSEDDFRFYEHPGMTRPKGKLGVVPGGQGDRLTTRGSAGLQKPLVDFKPSPTEYAKGYDPSKTFVEKPGAIEDLKGIATDGLKLGEKWIDAIAGKTAVDFKPRDPKEAAAFNKFKKGYEIFVAAIKEGGGVFGGTLYETGGGRTTMPDTKTGEVPQAHFPNVLKTLRKVFAGEKDPIVMQDYGDLHWATIIATISLANTYGPIVWAIPGLRTMADTIGASMNGMLMDKPNLEGNPIQDTMHRLFWIAGQAGQKVYENSVGKIIEKLRGTPKSEKTRGTISEELNDLFNIKDAFKGHETKRIKVSGDVEAAGEKHLQPSHDPLDLGTTTQKPGKSIEDPDDFRGQREQVVGQELSPVAIERPQEPIDEAKIEALADEIMGQAPTGDEPFVIKGDYTPKPEPEVETKPEVREPPKLDLPELDPETLKELEELGDDEKGKGLDQPLHLWLPVDNWGSQYGDAEFDEDNIVGVEYRPHWPKEGEGEEFEREANRLGDKWMAEQGTVDEKPDDPTKEPEPGYNQVRGSDGKIYDKNPNGWKDQYNPNSGLIDSGNSSTWDPNARWDDSVPDYIRGGLPSSHPQHERNRPEWDKPFEGGGGTIPREPTADEIESEAHIYGMPYGDTYMEFEWIERAYNNERGFYEEVLRSGHFWIGTTIEGSGQNFSWDYDWSNLPSGAVPAYGRSWPTGNSFQVKPGP